MKPLKIPSNLTALAYESIKDHILTGQLNEDTRLTEDSLAKQLGISKSPIREALNRLEAEGLIRIEPRRGAYIRTFSPDDVQDLYDLWEALEVHAVRRAHLSPELTEELRQNLKRMRKFLKANDKPAFIREDIAFHAAITQASGNARLAKEVQNVQNQLLLLRRTTYELCRTSAPDLHEAILDALEREDRTKAEALMREHIGSVRRALVEFLRAHESRGPVAANP
jgi:DNA-binding GntR family transcriptional regulator